MQASGVRVRTEAWSVTAEFPEGSCLMERGSPGEMDRILKNRRKNISVRLG